MIDMGDDTKVTDVVCHTAFRKLSLRFWEIFTGKAFYVGLKLSTVPCMRGKYNLFYSNKNSASLDALLHYYYAAGTAARHLRDGDWSTFRATSLTATLISFFGIPR